MSGKVDFVEGEHGPALIEGPATALSWLTVLPIKGASAFDRTTGARVMASLPIVGAVLGAVAAVIVAGLQALGVFSLLIGTLVVVSWALFTRFMHLDGLADVADALGSYADPARAREILADPHAGLIGMGSALLAMLVQIASIAAIVDATPQAFVIVFLIPFFARITGPVGANEHFHPMKPTGFGAMMIGTAKTWWTACWFLVACVPSLFAARVLDDAALLLICQGVLAVALGVAVALARHCSKRFGGLNGDTTGFIMETNASVIAALFAIALPLI